MGTESANKHATSSFGMNYNPNSQVNTASTSPSSSYANQSASYMNQPMGPPPPHSMGPAPMNCMICYNAHVDMMLEPCRHQFHSHCVEKFLAKEKMCPICWTPIQSHRTLMTAPPQASQYGGAPPPHPHHMGNGMPPRNSIPPGPPGSMPPPVPQQQAPGIPYKGPLQGHESILPSGAHGPDIPTSQMRKGKWTTEESAYCDRLIEEFKKGNLPLAEGTTLRTFLSKLLNCDPMRISKKYTGDQCIGKIIFRRREDELSKEDLEKIRRDLAELEKTYLEREQFNQRRREKRLESELSKDKTRFMGARALGGYGMPPPPNSMGLPVGGTPPMPPPPYPQQMNAQLPGGKIPQYDQRQSQSIAGQQFQVPPQQQMGQRVISSQEQPQQQQYSQQSTNMSARGVVEVKQDSERNVENASSGISAGSNENAKRSDMDEFPRVSSIDSFSCLFPRVASLENFQFPSNQNSINGQQSFSSSSFPESGATSGETSSASNPASSSLVKNMSIGDGLNAYFPRIQSLEQLSTLLQEHAPTSPRGNADTDDSKRQEDIKKEGESRRQDAGPEEEEPDESEAPTMDNDKEKLSPEPAGGMSSSNMKQLDAMQAPKPLSKLPRNSSGIFPRVPSRNELPRVPSMDKLEKLPRIPSMDKISCLDKIPRVPSMDKLPRVPSLDRFTRVNSSSDMLSRIGSMDQMNSFPSFSNLSGLVSCGSFDKLSSLASGGFGTVRSSMPRNSSIEDILSLVASSDSNSNGLANSNSSLQLSTLANLSEEASMNERKRRAENESNAMGLSVPDMKKSKV